MINVQCTSFTVFTGFKIVKILCSQVKFLVWILDSEFFVFTGDWFSPNSGLTKCLCIPEKPLLLRPKFLYWQPAYWAGATPSSLEAIHQDGFKAQEVTQKNSFATALDFLKTSSASVFSINSSNFHLNYQNIALIEKVSKRIKIRLALAWHKEKTLRKS